MGKIFLIMQREYFTRVRKKSFIIMSILAPVLFGALFIVPVLMATLTSDTKVIEILDEGGQFKGKFKDSERLKFVYTDLDLEQAKSNFTEQKHDGLLFIPALDLDKPKGIVLFSEKGLSIFTKENIEKIIRTEIENQKLVRSGIDKQVLDGIRTQVDITTITTGEGGEKESSSDAASGFGYVGAFLIYLFIFLYGAQIMRGVIEEKTNRIIEVIICSVKPFQLMMGKILGVGAVALTQFLIWIVLSTAVTTGVSAFFKVDEVANVPMEQALEKVKDSPEAQKAMQQQFMVKDVFSAIGSVNLPLVLGGFVFYFLFGYLMYGALFGAIGAAVDNETDTQQFMLPVTLPLILAIASMGVVIAEPDGQLAFWLSMFPLTSPIIMMIRLPFIGATWELYLSMLLLVLAFLGAVWLAGRIYRVGILMYGKKPTYKEIGKWLFYKV
jgi:ABC-2 type transport system permease protein